MRTPSLASPDAHGLRHSCKSGTVQRFGFRGQRDLGASMGSPHPDGRVGDHGTHQQRRREVDSGLTRSTFPVDLAS